MSSPKIKKKGAKATAGTKFPLIKIELTLRFS